MVSVLFAIGVALKAVSIGLAWGGRVGGLPGYQFVLAVSKCGPSISGACRVTWQVLPVRNRLCQVLAVTPDRPGTSPLTNRFLNSSRPLP